MPEREKLDLSVFNMRRNFSIPNLISLFRLLLIPLIIYLYVNGKIWEAVVAVGVSALSDVADGYVARHFNQITPLGKVLDPVADKLTQVALAICLMTSFPVLIPLLIVLVIKELTMLYWGVCLLKVHQPPFSARWWGKVSTTSFYVGALVIMIFSRKMSGGWIFAICAVIILLMLYSLFRYGQVFRYKIKKAAAQNS
ncbi:MAG: CDP-alcohol phosphatidyltransferase family protein [Firmicutes bacterium]|jgi:cardiolipin synthase|nr:CDP-alcohol phosphatidyltransferase family protein [Bacillota bacterium]